MNYKSINKPNLKLTNHTISKNLSHNKASKSLIDFLAYFFKIYTFIIETVFSNAEYTCDKNSISSKVHNTDYNITDITELRLIASRRTFL
jgi:hypothetical protein